MTDVFNPIPLACPLDGLPLSHQDRSFNCVNGHSYDIAKQGYLNLLPVQFKSSKDPGDSKSMVTARRAVLSQGYYERLSDTLCDISVALIKQINDLPCAVVDAGCGEGYYSARLQQRLADEFGDDAAAVLAMDISKWSVMAAAKSYQQLACAVATNKHLPVITGSAALIVSLFGFATWQSWAELQKPGQWVVTADPGPDHLLELRKRIYDEVRLHDAYDDPAAAMAGYHCIEQKSVTYSTQVKNGEALLAILEMTPHGRRVTADKRTALAALTVTSLTIDVVLRVFVRQERDPLPLD